MRQFGTIARNAFMELVRQPVFLLLQTAAGAFAVFLAVVPYFGFGDDPKMVKDSVLAVMLVSGLVSAVLSASASVAHEIRTGTALAVLAKPVSRVQFLLAKYVGVAAALTVLTYYNLLAALLASRMAFDAYGSADRLALGIYALGVAIAYAIGGFRNYFLHRPFISDAVASLLAVGTIGFVAINFLDKDGNFQTFAKGVDWRLVPAAVLILLALWTLAGVALACSTRFDMIATLAICTGVFLLGLMSDYLLGERSEQGQPWAMILYGLTPNWQLFWMSDALDGDKSIPWSYVGRTLGYTVTYLGGVLALALMLFEDRELS
jgi:ABC-type transport system involved in multi-copper enzyme maturation permease subunit